ncbi:MAG: hypothetical protein K2X82_13815 [Gemmataceae bacterium]|nr:hypothetical protein [Gemmataceae bacterium]
MAAKGGGSWKVAYADFVTAMMAFFLVMWIGAQDSKVRQSVANYFVDPEGVAKKPVRTGAVLDSIQYGSLPDQQKTATNRGRTTHTVPGEPSHPTRLVSNWVHADPQRLRAWHDRAEAAREAAAKSPEVTGKGADADEVAVRQLAGQLRAELTAAAGGQPGGVYQDLLFGALWEVNWTEVAQDLLTTRGK